MGQMAASASPSRSPQLATPTDSSMTATTKWLQAAARRRMSRTASSSSVPTTPAAMPLSAPPPASHSDMRAQNGSLQYHQARSLANTETRKAIGNGTSIACAGWPKKCTRVVVPWGRGSA